MNYKELTEQYKKQLIYYGLTETDIESVSHILYTPGDIIYREGDPLKYLFLILSGSVKIYTSTSNDNSLLIHHPFEKGVLCETEALLGYNCTTATIIAHTEVDCLRLPVSFFFSRLQYNAPFLLQVCKNLSLKTTNAIAILQLRTLHSAKSQICYYILANNRKGYFSSSLTEASEDLNISYRHLLRIISELCKDKVLEKTVRGYKIIDMEMLEEFIYR